MGRNSAPDYHRRWKGWVNSWAKAINDPSSTPFLQTAVEGAPDKDRTTVRRLREYCNVVASMTSWDGKDPVFSSRDMIATEMGCSVRLISRCARAAERAGVVTEGIQPYWIKGYNGDEPVHARTSTIRFLTLDPDIGTARKERANDRRRLKARRAASKVNEANKRALEARKAADQAHEDRMAELVLEAPTRSSLEPRRPHTDEECASARAGLARARSQIPE